MAKKKALDEKEIAVLRNSYEKLSLKAACYIW